VDQSADLSVDRPLDQPKGLYHDKREEKKYLSKKQAHVNKKDRSEMSTSVALKIGILQVQRDYIPLESSLL
jgi:hypothetical protein